MSGGADPAGRRPLYLGAGARDGPAAMAQRSGKVSATCNAGPRARGPGEAGGGRWLDAPFAKLAKFLNKVGAQPWRTASRWWEVGRSLPPTSPALALGPHPTPSLRSSEVVGSDEPGWVGAWACPAALGPAPHPEVSGGEAAPSSRPWRLVLCKMLRFEGHSNLVADLSVPPGYLKALDLT